MGMPERPKRRMLLIASIGVATVSYALGCQKQPAGNLAQPLPAESGTASPVAGNLMPSPPVVIDAGPAPETPPDVSPVSGNLMAPRPQDTAPLPTASTSAKKPPPPKPPVKNPHAGNLMAPRTPDTDTKQ